MDVQDNLPAGAPAAAGTMDGHSQHTTGDQESPADAEDQRLSLAEFNKFAPLAGVLERRSNQAAKNRKKMTVTSDERNRLMEMQQRLGLKQTGSFDNATRHALHAEFVELIRPAAEAEEKKTGIPAAVTIGQACLETGYGLHVPTDVKTGQRSNNLFGIKAVKGQTAVNSWTHEYDKKGNLVSVIQPFAVYDSIGGSIPEHSAFLKKYPRYKSLFSSSDPEKWAQGLQDAGYGGKDNKKYAAALVNTMRTWKLIK